MTDYNFWGELYHNQIEILRLPYVKLYTKLGLSFAKFCKVMVNIIVYFRKT